MARCFFLKRHAAQAAVIAYAIEVGEKIERPRLRSRQRAESSGPQARRIRPTRRFAALDLHEIESDGLDVRPEIERLDFQYVLRVRHLALTRPPKRSWRIASGNPASLFALPASRKMRRAFRATP